MLSASPCSVAAGRFVAAGFAATDRLTSTECPRKSKRTSVYVHVRM